MPTSSREDFVNGLLAEPGLATRGHYLRACGHQPAPRIARTSSRLWTPTVTCDNLMSEGRLPRVANFGAHAAIDATKTTTNTPTSNRAGYEGGKFVRTVSSDWMRIIAFSRAQPRRRVRDNPAYQRLVPQEHCTAVTTCQLCHAISGC